MNDSGDLGMLPHYVEPWKKPQKFKEQLSHHLKYFRYSHKTEISTQSNLTLEEFFNPDPLLSSQENHALLPKQSKAINSQSKNIVQPLLLQELRAEHLFLSESGF